MIAAAPEWSDPRGASSNDYDLYLNRLTCRRDSPLRQNFESLAAGRL